jgi:hypothetical protein
MRSPADLLGLHPSSEELANYIEFVSSLVPAQDATIPQVKSFSDAVYFNYFPLGLSLLFKPQDGYKPTPGLKQCDLKDEKLIIDSIDVYNTPKNMTTRHESTRVAELAFLTHPVMPLNLTFSAPPTSGSESGSRRELVILAESTGKDFVKSLGEPDRKGGGAGPSSGSIGIWCEWSKAGIMVEFGGEEARGPQAWERGKDAVWRVVTVFSSQ